MATKINRSKDTIFAREGERVVEQELQDELERIEIRLQRELSRLLCPCKGYKYAGTFSRPSGWERKPKGYEYERWNCGTVIETPQRYLDLLQQIEAIQALGLHRSARLRVGEDLPYPGFGGDFGSAYVLAQEWAISDEEIFAIMNGGNFYERLFWTFKFEYVEEVIDTYITTEPYFGASREEVGDGALVEFHIDQGKVSEIHAEILRVAKDRFPDFIWEGLNRGKVCPGSETDRLIKDAKNKIDEARARAKAEAEAQLSQIRTMVRIWHRNGATRAGKGWVIAPDGSLREPDVIDTSMHTSKNKRRFQSREGDHIWLKIEPGELVLRWAKANTAAEHEFEVVHCPECLTDLQLERVAEIQDEIEASWKGKTGLSSGRMSPSVGQGWGLFPRKVSGFGIAPSPEAPEPPASAEVGSAKDGEIDFSSPMAKAFAAALAGKK